MELVRIQLPGRFGVPFSSAGTPMNAAMDTDKVDTTVSMRPLIGSGEAAGYLEQLPRLKPQPLTFKKPAELAAHYQEVLVPDDPKSLLLLIKEIYFKEKELTAHRKKLGQVDSRYLKVAERLVCEEFAVALQTSPESIKKRLYARMTQ